MTAYSIISGTFAEVFTGNCTSGWLPEGDDLQVRANAAGHTSDGRDCPIFRRHVPGHALVCHGAHGDTYVLYTSLDAAMAAKAAAEG